MSHSGISTFFSTSSLIESSILDDKENVLALHTFRDLVKSCYGTNGHLKTIQHYSGGQVTLTSSSYDLLKNLQIRRPFLRLLVTVVTEHLKLFHDGGLFVALLTAELISVSLSAKIPRILCCDVNSILLGWCNEFMSEKCRVPVDIGNMDEMMAVVQSVISSKPACCFSRADVQHVSSLILQSFLKTFPTSNDHKSSHQCIQYVEVAGHDIKNSKIVDGVIFQLAKETPDQVLPSVDKFTSGTGSLKVALFNISLAGDTDDFIDVQYNIAEGLSPMDVVTENLFDIAKQLLSDSVDVLGCQKVIHPSIKKFLKRNNVLVIDRLSNVNIAAVEKLTGARCISSLHYDDTMKSMYGRLEKVEITTHFKKSYYHLVNNNSSVCTLFLCSRMEATLQEIKSVCKVAQSMLVRVMVNPTFVPGAGCFEILLANHLKKKVHEIDTTLCSGIGSSKYQFKSAAENLISSLQTVAISNQIGYPVTNNSQSHLWIVTDQAKLNSDWIIDKVCNCGLCHFDCSEDVIEIKNTNIQTEICNQNYEDKNMDCKNAPPKLHQNVVIDHYDIKMNGLNIAVETGNLILRIQQQISIKI